MNRKKILSILSIITLLFSFSSCSKDEIMDEVSGVRKKGKNFPEFFYDDNIDEQNINGSNVAHYRFDKNKDNFHKLGEEVTYISGFTNLNLDGVPYSKFKINDAQIYNSTKDADIKTEELMGASIYDIKNKKYKMHFEGEELEDKKILLCNIDVTNLSESGIDPRLCFELQLVYAQDDSCTQICNGAIYFSDHVINQYGKYSTNILVGETKNVNVAWIMDPELLEIEDFDPSNLYFITNANIEFANKPRDFFELGL